MPKLTTERIQAAIEAAEGQTRPNTKAPGSMELAEWLGGTPKGLSMALRLLGLPIAQALQTALSVGFTVGYAIGQADLLEGDKDA